MAILAKNAKITKKSLFYIEVSIELFFRVQKHQKPKNDISNHQYLKTIKEPRPKIPENPEKSPKIEKTTFWHAFFTPKNRFFWTFLSKNLKTQILIGLSPHTKKQKLSKFPKYQKINISKHLPEVSANLAVLTKHHQNFLKLTENH